MTRLLGLLRDAASGQWPPVDGLTEVRGAPTGARGAIVAFTGHHVVAASVDPEWVARACAPWALEVPFGAAFVSALAQRLNARAGTLDVVLVGEGRASPGIALRAATAAETASALADAPQRRDAPSVWLTFDGVGRLILGRGLEGRWEAAISVEAGARSQGLGRNLALAARALIEPGELVFAQIAPGNVASLRPALAAGFRPVAAEILFFD